MVGNRATTLLHRFGFLEVKQYWGKRICIVHFSGVPYGMDRMEFQVGGR